MIPYLRFEILSGTYLSRPYMGLSPPPPPQDFTCHVASKLKMDLEDDARLFINFLLLNVAFVI